MHKFNTSGSSGTCILRHLTAHQEKTNSLPNKSLLLLREVPHVRHPLWEEIWWWHILEGTVGTDTAHAQMQKGGYSEGPVGLFNCWLQAIKKENSYHETCFSWLESQQLQPRMNTNLLRISEHHMEEKAIRFLHYCKFGITSLKKSSSADIS